MYKPVEENGTYCIISYKGNESEVFIPEMYCGHPITVLFDDLFKGHNEITKVHIPDSVTNIGGFVFDGCTNLREIVLPANLENMWQYAFVRSGIEEITLPPKIKYISPFTFKDCKRLRKVVCNDALEEICAHAFDGCDNLVEVIHNEKLKVNL